MLKVVIHGAKGKMGRTLAACCASARDFQVAGEVDLGDDLSKVLQNADVIIDFSSHSVTHSVAEAAAAQSKALVIGTTGHTPEEQERVRQYQKNIPIVWSANFSTGINTLFWLARKAAEVLRHNFDIELVEMHHRQKIDAPSGTAVKLLEILQAGATGSVVRHGREGLLGARPEGEIGVHSLRGGDVIGDHTVIFAGPGERVELSHKASNRETFAWGALQAAQWVVGKPPGLYSMQDVLGLT